MNKLTEGIDSKGNRFFDVGEVRVTCIGKTKSGSGGIRIQAYTGIGKKLHRGAEIPIPNNIAAYDLIAVIVAALDTLERRRLA